MSFWFSTSNCQNIWRFRTAFITFNFKFLIGSNSFEINNIFVFIFYLMDIKFIDFAIFRKAWIIKFLWKWRYRTIYSSISTTQRISINNNILSIWFLNYLIFNNLMMLWSRWISLKQMGNTQLISLRLIAFDYSQKAVSFVILIPLNKWFLVHQT